MTALPIVVAAALVAADAPSSEPERGTPPPPVAAPAAATRRPLSLAAGVSLASIDGIPVTLGIARVGLAALRPGGGVRAGFGLFLELGGGRTENGLGLGEVLFGPHLLFADDRLRGGVGLEVGTIGVARATDGSLGFIAAALFRGSLEIDVWRFGRRALFFAATGSLGGTGEGRYRGWGALVGVRP